MIQLFHVYKSYGKDKNALKRRAEGIYNKSTNINSLGDRIGANRIKYKQLHDLEEKNLYRR